MSEPIRILIVDDQNIFREGVKALLASVEHMEVIGEATNGRDGIIKAQDLMPDVILMDIKMPDINGIEATQKINDAMPHIGIIVLTMYKDDESVFSAMRAGARGYLLKSADQHEMRRAIQAVFNGEAIFAADIAQRLINYFTVSRKVLMNDLFPKLTPREVEVLRLIIDKLSNKEIAQELTISPKTVRNHISNIFRKLQVSDRMEAILYAKKAGLSP